MIPSGTAVSVIVICMLFQHTTLPPGSAKRSPPLLFLHFLMFTKTKKIWASLALLALAFPALAQSGVAGLNTATSTLKTYVDPVTNITLVIGGIVGIVGAIRVYSKWNSGDQDINKELMGWGGSCVFLVVSALVIKSFFGL
ncbi:hypothetical protein QE417_000346 [Mucilaginibacter terrae]|uniref:DUF4134 domain-containing protein n=2 Tax=Mucilaginibacter terrae TaxID=1955052 RepID=A0ABU3GNC5_9SPHI|nr:hypothetical protein [Mucilaginibacter terrae]